MGVEAVGGPLLDPQFGDLVVVELAFLDQLADFAAGVGKGVGPRIGLDGRRGL